MFRFFRRSAPRPVSDAIARAIDSQGFAPALGDTAQLRMVESSGRYSNRKVTYFRIYDPAVAAQRSLDIQRYRDLDAFQGLVLRAGHVESDGQIVLNRPDAVRGAEMPPRTRAGRIVPTVPADTQTPADVDAVAGTSMIDPATPGPVR